MRYKPNIRVLKNARNSAGNTFPSYFLECLVYNVPVRFFEPRFAPTFRNVVDYLAAADDETLGSFCCQNEQQCPLRHRTTSSRPTVCKAVHPRSRPSMEQLRENRPFYILSLDGGGSLGVYTLGILVRDRADWLERDSRPHLTSFTELARERLLRPLIALGERVRPTDLPALFWDRPEHYEALAAEREKQRA